MKILAIQTGHNATVAISENGEILGCLSQEKVDNIKNSSAFPLNAIDILMDYLKIKKNEIDAIAIPGLMQFNHHISQSPPLSKTKKTILSKIKNHTTKYLTLFFPNIYRKLQKTKNYFHKKKAKASLECILKTNGFDNIPIHYIDHHECHTYSAHFFSVSPNNKTLIFTADGTGDLISSTVSMSSRTKSLQQQSIKRLSKDYETNSLGYMYSNVTAFLGMKVLEHEYKVIGLAPYTKESYGNILYEKFFKNIIVCIKGKFKSKYPMNYFFHYLKKHCVGQRFDNIAYAAQKLLETQIVEWISYWAKQQNINTISCGGGVFMNVKLNKKIQEISSLNHVTFMPSCGDESNPIGACYYLSEKKGIKPKPLKNLYLGIAFSNSQIKQFLEKNNNSQFDYYFIDHMESHISQLLAEREIVARFSGKNEWGARSLGNRAILAHPSYMESFYTVNDLIKCRDFWMPFAPTILEASAKKYLKNYNHSKEKPYYMISAYEATDLAKKELKAALHQGDHTLRPQILLKEHNKNIE